MEKIKIIKMTKYKLEKILNQSYLEFFPIYYQKENYTNLKKYGLDIDISLENLKRFDFFIKKEKEKIKELENKEKYEKGIEESIRENFMTNSHLFIVNSKKIKIMRFGIIKFSSNFFILLFLFFISCIYSIKNYYYFLFELLANMLAI